MAPRGNRFLGGIRRGLLGAVATAGVLLVAAPPALAATSSIDHVQAVDGQVRAVVSVAGTPSGVGPDLGSVTVTFAGEEVEATAAPFSAEQHEQLQRTVILALDVSGSMAGRQFAEAKAAAAAFLDAAPADVRVGLVTFAGTVTVVEAPTTEHDEVKAALGSLRLSEGTRAHDALLESVHQLGSDGVRSILLLTDGADTSRTSVDEVTTAVAEADVNVDVVALDTSPTYAGTLRKIARAGGGAFFTAAEPGRLTALFGAEAEALGEQVVVSFEPPAELAGREGSLEVTLDVDGAAVTDSAFVALPAAAVAEGSALGSTLPPAESGPVIAKEWMVLALVAAGLALVAVVYLAVGAVGGRQQDTVTERIDVYTRAGARAPRKAKGESSTVTEQAVAMAATVLENRKGASQALAARLEAAGMSLKAAEWLLLHAGVAFGVGLLGLLLGGGSFVGMILGLLLGAAAPWLYLMLKRRRRVGAFKAQLADTLQLMSGSLSAGLSLAQGVDTVVREGAEPMAGELRRALVESRLGVNLEEALSGVGKRMESLDFEWVVMAIRIQREVGGNLAELLTKVAETIREREYLERQIKTLSAEGRLSVWILAGLPPLFMLYLVLTNPTYVSVLFTSPLGWAMLIVMVLLLVGGTFWMTRMVKVEV